MLIGIGQAIKDGETTVNDAFRPKQTTAMKDVDIAPIEVKETKSFTEKMNNSQTGKIEFE